MTAAIKINANDGVTRNVMVGGETTVDFDFPIFDATHIELYETDTSGVITQLTKDTDFTVPAGSVNVQAGGTLNLDSSQYPSGATAGHVFTAYQAAPYSRTTDFNQAGDFFADTLNQELDLISQQIQQIRRDLARAPLAPVDTTLTSLSLADPIDEYILMWDGVTGSIGTVALSSISLAGFDTLFTSLENNDGLFYNSSQTRWENETPAETRTRLSLVAGTNIQAYDAGLASIAGLTTAADKMIYATASDTYATTDITSFARTILDDADAAAARSTLGFKGILGHGYASTGAYDSTTTAFPEDDSIPQNTEGKEALTLAYTPVSATSKLLIECGALLAGSGSVRFVGIALFKDSDADALAITGQGNPTADYFCASNLVYEMTSGGTSEITFKLRFGPNSGTAYLNGNTAAPSGRKYGGTANTYIKVTEIEA